MRRKKLKDSKLLRISIIVGIILSVVMITNTALNTYMLLSTSFTASTSSNEGERLQVDVQTGVPGDMTPDYNADWIVNGSLNWECSVVNAVNITVTGTNIQNTVSVDCYIKAVSAADPEKWTKELDATGAIVTVGGAPYENTTGYIQIGTHLDNMGLNAIYGQTHTIDYYVYMKATATGIISGEPLITEIIETKFTTVTYELTACFAGDTLVTMSDWSQKRIDEIRVGEQVKSYDLDNKTFINASVTHVFRHTPDEMGDYYLIVETDLGHVVKVTPNHIIYSNGNWVQAGEIKIDDILLDDLGRNTTVTEVRRIYDQIPTFNLEVEGSHIFFAGNLVHNEVKPSWYIIPSFSLVSINTIMNVMAALSMFITAIIILKTRRKNIK